MPRKHKEGVDRQVENGLPTRLDDWVESDNPVRALDAYVDGLDLSALGFDRTAPNPTAAGQPAFPPQALLKLFVYGYLNRIRSSRALEKECVRNLEVIWLLRGLRPGYGTIAAFRRRNADALRRVSSELLARCRAFHLVGGERVAVDGSHFNGNVSDKSFRSVSTLEEDIQRLADTLDARRAVPSADPEDLEASARVHDADVRREDLRALEARKTAKEDVLGTLKASGETQVSRTDPDARLLNKRGQTTAGYSVQIVVDARHKLIVADDVVQDRNDLGQLYPMLKRAKAALGVETLEGKADRGYFNLSQIARCEADGITVYVPEPARGGRQHRGGRYPPEAFQYRPDEDAYRCPADQRLTRRGSPRDAHGSLIQRYAASETSCRACRLRDQCITAQSTCRELYRHEHEALLQAHRRRMADNPGAMRERSLLAEHPFGTLKCRAGWTHFLVRGLDKVRGEWSLMALAYNFTRAMNGLGRAVFAVFCTERIPAPA